MSEEHELGYSQADVCTCTDTQLGAHLRKDHDRKVTDAQARYWAQVLRDEGAAGYIRRRYFEEGMDYERGER